MSEGTQERREKHIEARITQRRQVAEDLVILRVAPAAPFSFLAGQYATLSIEREGNRIERAYSLCSSPYESELEFFVERVPSGQLSPLLHALDNGSALHLRKIAKGRFTLDLRSGRKNHLLLATVTGIAPFVSYARTLYHDWKAGNSPMPGEHRLFCIQGASFPHEFGYREELERIAAEVSWIEYIPTLSRAWESPDWHGERGRTEDILRDYGHRWALSPSETSAYLCGHPGMIETGRGILLRAGWAKDAIFEEAYFQQSAD